MGGGKIYLMMREHNLEIRYEHTECLKTLGLNIFYFKRNRIGRGNSATKPSPTHSYRYIHTRLYIYDICNTQLFTYTLKYIHTKLYIYTSYSTKTKISHGYKPGTTNVC